MTQFRRYTLQLVQRYRDEGLSRGRPPTDASASLGRNRREDDLAREKDGVGDDRARRDPLRGAIAHCVQDANRFWMNYMSVSGDGRPTGVGKGVEGWQTS
jgi:hypothetical protein